MAGYLREAFGEWPEAEDRQHHARWMAGGRAQVILVGDEIAGSLEVVRRDDTLWLLRLELDPRLQGRGLGRTIVRDLQQQAAAEGRRMELNVFPHNPARRLYERLGFREIGREGPSITMAWLPPPA